MSMTHARAFADSSFEYVSEYDEVRIRSCHRPLRYVGTHFHSDVLWTVFACDECRVEVYTVGGVHWWNYEQPFAARGRAL
jgi:hypothetical protein